MIHRFILSACALALALPVMAQTAAQKAPLSAHVLSDVQRHRAMAAAHEGAARCLEAGRTEAACLKELQAACKGLAIGQVLWDET